MNNYPRVHVNCGGKLNFAKSIVETKVLNEFAVKKYNAKAKIKQFNKDLYKCDECDKLVSVIDFPSWEEYVLMGRIRLPKWQYRKIKKEAELRKAKLEAQV